MCVNIVNSCLEFSLQFLNKEFLISTQGNYLRHVKYIKHPKQSTLFSRLNFISLRKLEFTDCEKYNKQKLAIFIDKS